MRTFKGFLYDTIFCTLVLIPIMAAVAGLILFVSNVLFGMEWSFIDLWRKWYIVSWTIIMGYIVFAMISRYLIFLSLARKLERPFNKIEKGILVHKLYKKLPTEEWTQIWFDEQYSVSEAIEIMTKAIVETLSKRR